MELKYKKVKLIQPWHDHAIGEVFNLDEDSANWWVEIGRAEIVHGKTKITDQSDKVKDKPLNPGTPE